MEWTEISKHTYFALLDTFFDLYEERYHRTVVTRELFIEDQILENVTLHPTLLAWLREWQKGD